VEGCGDGGRAGGIKGKEGNIKSGGRERWRESSQVRGVTATSSGKGVCLTWSWLLEFRQVSHSAKIAKRG
jgi:hypothetical protein